MATLSALLDGLAAEKPSAPALIDRDRPVSYAALADESARLASGLAALGIRADDRVALWLPNLPAWLAAFFALIASFHRGNGRHDLARAR